MNEARLYADEPMVQNTYNTGKLDGFFSSVNKLVSEILKIDLAAYEEDFTYQHYLDLRNQVLRALNDLYILVEGVCKSSDTELLTLFASISANPQGSPKENTRIRFFRDSNIFIKSKLTEKKINIMKTMLEQDNHIEVLEKISAAVRVIIGYGMMCESPPINEEKIDKSPTYEKILRDAIATRKMYAGFRLKIAAIEQEEQDITKRLRSAGNIIATILGNPLSMKLRPFDRQLFRDFQSRIIKWFNSDSEKDANGRHLWQDIQGATQFLMGINNRCILYQNDRISLKRLGEIFRNKKMANNRKLAVFEEVSKIWGFSFDLDRLLYRMPATSLEELRQVLDPIMEKVRQEKSCF